MAYMEFDFPEDMMDKLLNTDFDDICQEALKEAAPIMETAMKKSMSQTIQHEGDSEMIASVKATKPKKTKTDAWIVNVGPTGYSKVKKYYAKSGKGIRTSRQYSVSNALKAIWKEYGIAGRQQAQPFLRRAKNDAQSAIERKIQEIYDRKTGAE